VKPGDLVQARGHIYVYPTRQTYYPQTIPTKTIGILLEKNGVWCKLLMLQKVYWHPLSNGSLVTIQVESNETG
jgi:hypothetical protein